MKACLNCQRDYENKRESSKFCSTNCRVKWNQKQPKKERAVSQVQLQVLYNSLLDLVSNAKQNPQSVSFEAKNTFSAPIPVQQPVYARKPKSMASYFDEKRELTCQEDYARWLEEVETDIHLKPYQKQILKTTNQ